MVDFDGVREELVQKFSGEQSSDQPESETAKSDAQSDEKQSLPEGSEQAEVKAQALMDLSKAEKFLIDGKEYTLKQLQQERLFHSDYTRKTKELAQEKQALQERQELEMHFRSDLPKVLRDPSLLNEMYKHYPKEFVEMAQAYLDLSPNQQRQATDQQGMTLDPRTIQRYVEPLVKPIQEKLDRYETETATKQLDAIFDKMKSKFGGVDDEFVLARLQALDSQKVPITEERIEEVFKYFHDKDIQGKEAYHLDKLKKQSEANKKSKDVGPGGGTPGQAPMKLKLNEVPDALIKHLSQR